METPSRHLPGSKPIEMLTTLLWWRQTARAVWALSPRFLAPAALMTVANLIGVIAMSFVSRVLAAPEANPESIVQSASGALFALLVSLVLSLWAVALWFFRLTSFARAGISHDGHPTVAQFDHASSELKKKIGYLAQVWLIASAYLVIPVIPIAALFSLKLVTAPGVLDKIGLPPVVLPEWMSVLIVVAMLALGVVTAAYTFMVFVLSSALSKTAVDVNHDAIKLCVKDWKSVLSITVLVLFANLLLSCPQIVDADQSQQALGLQIAVQFWLGAVSLFIWPTSLTPYCLLAASAENRTAK